MTLAMKLLCRVVKRRVEAGEALEQVLKDYPKLTEDERELCGSMLGNSNF